MYIINTDQGFIKGELHDHLYFTVKDDAREFTETEIRLHGDSITNDLITYYCCESVEIEYIK